MDAVRIRRDIADMQGYTFISGTMEALSQRLGVPKAEIIKLDTNENLYGASPKALAALGQLDADFHIYPDIVSHDLRLALADFTGVSAEHVLVGNGADELIDLTLRLFLEPGDSIIDCPPTFTMYSLTASWLGNCNVIQVPRRADFSLDLDAIEVAVAQHQPKLLFLCHPNNPDGGLVSAESMRRLLDLPLTVVVDEAYIEFADAEDFTHWVPENANLIVLRTMSKWAALAGMRVGYGIYPLAIIEHLWKIKHPFNVNVAADLMARATLADQEYYAHIIGTLTAERERMLILLQAIAYLQALPSHGNFILCRVTDRPTAELKRDLDAKAILIRNYNKPGLEDYVRISIGKAEHTDALISALKELER